MNVDTGAFRALTDQVAELAAEVETLKNRAATADLFEELRLGCARRRGDRPAHLRAIDGGQP